MQHYLLIQHVGAEYACMATYIPTTQTAFDMLG